MFYLLQAEKLIDNANRGDFILANREQFKAWIAKSPFIRTIAILDESAFGTAKRIIESNQQLLNMGTEQTGFSRYDEIPLIATLKQLDSITWLDDII